MIIRIILAFVGAFLISLAAGRLLVPALRRIKAGQSIRKDGPVWHMSKQGTPTMGGLMFIFAIVIITVCGSIPELLKGQYGHLIVLLLALINGTIGFFDDYEKLKKKQNMGLTALQKLLLQIAASVVFVLLLRHFGYLSTDLYIPFFNTTFHIPELAYFVFAAFVMVATVNAVNITDGVDGLVTGVSLPVAVFYTVVAAVWGYTALGIFGAALTGALAGFLVYNFHPAKVFMGDTGSLFLGGAVCAMAFALNMPLIILTLGILYILEVLSDVIQVTYFKLSHGKRIFKMAPLHHHLEMCGWSENKLFAVCTALSAVFAVISYWGVSNRF